MGIAATVTQKYVVEGIDHPVWKAVNRTSRAKNKSEENYGKIDGESLGILSGKKNNQMYLYGIPFTVIVDHESLVSMYNLH